MLFENLLPVDTNGETNMDLQDDCRSDLQYGEITEKIIGCAFEVINELGTDRSRTPGPDY